MEDYPTFRPIDLLRGIQRSLPTMNNDDLSSSPSSPKVQERRDPVAKYLLKLTPHTETIIRTSNDTLPITSYSGFLSNLINALVMADPQNRPTIEANLFSLISTIPTVSLDESTSKYPDTFLSKILMDNFERIREFIITYPNLDLTSRLTKFLVKLVYSLQFWEVYHLINYLPNFKQFLILLDFEVVESFDNLIRPPRNFLKKSLYQGFQYPFPYPFYNYSYHPFDENSREKYKDIKITPYMDIRLQKEPPKKKRRKRSTLQTHRDLSHNQQDYQAQSPPQTAPEQPKPDPHVVQPSMDRDTQPRIPSQSIAQSSSPEVPLQQIQPAQTPSQAELPTLYQSSHVGVVPQPQVHPPQHYPQVQNQIPQQATQKRIFYFANNHRFVSRDRPPTANIAEVKELRNKHFPFGVPEDMSTENKFIPFYPPHNSADHRDINNLPPINYQYLPNSIPMGFTGNMFSPYLPVGSLGQEQRSPGQASQQGYSGFMPGSSQHFQTSLAQQIPGQHTPGERPVPQQLSSSQLQHAQFHGYNQSLATPQSDRSVTSHLSPINQYNPQPTTVSDALNPQMQRQSFQVQPARPSSNTNDSLLSGPIKAHLQNAISPPVGLGTQDALKSATTNEPESQKVEGTQAPTGTESTVNESGPPDDNARQGTGREASVIPDARQETNDWYNGNEDHSDSVSAEIKLEGDHVISSEDEVYGDGIRNPDRPSARFKPKGPQTQQCKMLNDDNHEPCGKLFYGKNELLRHQEFVHATRKKIYKCLYCSRDGNAIQTYPRHDSLARHIRRKHGVSGKENKLAVNYAKENVLIIDNANTINKDKYEELSIEPLPRPSFLNEDYTLKPNYTGFLLFTTREGFKKERRFNSPSESNLGQLLSQDYELQDTQELESSQDSPDVQSLNTSRTQTPQEVPGEGVQLFNSSQGPIASFATTYKSDLTEDGSANSKENA